MTPDLSVPSIKRLDTDAERTVQVQTPAASSSFARISYGITPATQPVLVPETFWRGAAWHYVRRFVIPALTAVTASIAAAAKIITFLASLYVIYTLAFVLSAVRPARPSSRLARLAARTRYALWQLEQQLPESERAQAS